MRPYSIEVAESASVRLSRPISVELTRFSKSNFAGEFLYLAKHRLGGDQSSIEWIAAGGSTEGLAVERLVAIMEYMYYSLTGKPVVRHSLVDEMYLNGKNELELGMLYAHLSHLFEPKERI